VLRQSRDRQPKLSILACRKMWTMSDVKETETLREQLAALDAEFDREMRARGFEPAQQENVALPAHLAELYKQREQIKAELAELTEEKSDD
jgi:predicted RNase H-like nuclease (RuvC/YqgF family)